MKLVSSCVRTRLDTGWAGSPDTIQNIDYTLAQQENNSISPIDLMEANHKKVNEIYLNSWAQERIELDSSERSILEPIAIQNPIEGGKAVYSARVMLDVILDDFSTESTARLAKPITESEKEIEFIFLADNFFISKIYPNPSTGLMQIDYLIDKKEVALLEIMEISGKVINNFLLNPEDNNLMISENLPAGIYFYRINSGDKVILLDKLVMIK